MGEALIDKLKEKLKARRAALAAELERLLATANWLQGRIAQLDELIEEIEKTEKEER